MPALLQATHIHAPYGAARSIGGLSMLPLLGPNGSPPDYLTLDEALLLKVAHVTEVSEHGSVPELKFVNGDDRPVLLLDGEELVGARQNRVLNLTILAPPHSATLIPVSCVEAGRWRWASARFSTSDRAHHASGRSRKVRQVTASMDSTGVRTSDQHAVWADLAGLQQRSGSRSGTGAMSDAYECRRPHLDTFVAELRWQEEQAGAAFFIGSRLVGVEQFDHPATMRKLLHKIVRSYAMDAIDARNDPDDSPAESLEWQAERFLAGLSQAPSTTFKAIGIGQDVRIRGPRVTGAALVVGNRTVHLCAFAVN